MTEWDASDYARVSGLQQAMAEEVLALLALQGTEQILDVGCGNGKITAEIARADATPEAVMHAATASISHATDLIEEVRA